ncbi:DNA methyltransferase [Brachybacterium alimentarium]|uniref:DNA methyltransferase n=1 Tax=Brachybacterium alimentarium TaxID=47845 RepID=UPI000DF31193|nr:DNA methyltransferase [Brachybacterium alimentarium]RCS80207.1 class I SAM-dependent DNA methyltransferase [Brachybacterium alimentarium]
MSQKPLVLPDVRSRAGAFVAQWRDAEGYERGEAQSFVRDLLRVFGITRSGAALYEKRAQRASTGGQGYIDALISGTALIEMKSTGADLAKAEAQALDYMESLTEHERPDFVITSNFKHFRLLDLAADSPETELLEFPLEELPAHVEDLMFLAGYRRAKFGSLEQETASIKAAQLMAKLYEHLEATGYDEHQASIFLIRTLFCLYADDSGLWERDLFSRYIEERTSEDGSDLGAQLTTLYQALNKPEDKRYGRDDDLIQAFPYVNGSVFGEAVEIPYFDRASRELLLQAAYFNWSSISPAIFGSMFQAVKSKKARRGLGEHYTTETNILKVIRPLFLDELEDQFTKAHAKKRELEKLLEHLGSLAFLDPACGCGNFLIIAYRELRALELRIHERLQELDPSRAQLSLDAESRVHVKLSQFYGIEIEEWPATIARTAMFLVEHQANQAVNLTLGYTVPMLPLQDSARITVANALRIDWNDVVPASESVFVMGNPPFLGPHSRTAEQLADMQAAWGAKDLGRLDFVTAWHKKSIDFFGPTNGGRFAFVSTNSIAQGDQAPRLFTPLFAAGWRVAFAHQTFAWTSEAPDAAAVHCTVVGFDKAKKGPARLFAYGSLRGEPHEIPTPSISAYLVPGPSDVIVTSRSTPLSPELHQVVLGSMAKDGGHLIVEPEGRADVMADPIAARYVRPYLGSRELIHGEQRWCLWLDGADPQDISRSPVLRQRVQAVKEFRLSAKAPSTHEFARIPHLFTQRATQDTAFVCIPRVSSENRPYLPVLHLESEVVASDANYQVQDPDGLQFALLSSAALMAWQKAIGGRLKNDLRFAVRTVWNNFPLPALTNEQRARIIEAGQRVLEARALHPERSLAQHYSPLAMDPALVKAHAALDHAVDRAFGAKKALRSNEERTALLFDRYVEMTSEPTPNRPSKYS